MIMLLKKLRAKPISLLTFNLLLSIWLGLFLNFAFYEKLQSLTPYTGIKAGLFVAASAVVVVSAYFFLFQLLNWKWTAKPVAIAMVFIGGFASYAVSTLGVLITSDQIQNLMQTDIAEARDTWSIHLVTWTLGMTVLPIIAILIV